MRLPAMNIVAACVLFFIFFSDDSNLSPPNSGSVNLMAGCTISRGYSIKDINEINIFIFHMARLSLFFQADYYIESVNPANKLQS